MKKHQYQAQLSNLIEDITVQADANLNQFVSLDQMITPRDVRNLEDQVDSNLTSPGAGMNTEDLKLLGFHMLEEEEVVPQQRQSKIEVTYQSQGVTKPEGKTSSSFNKNSDGAGSSIVRSIALSPDGEDDYEEDQDRPTQKPKGNRIIFRPESNIENRIEKMSQNYKKIQEKKIKAVSIHLTNDQIKQMQLDKLYRLAQQIKTLRVQDMMQNMIIHRAKKADKNSLIESFFKESKKEDLLEISDKMIDMFFNNWGNELSELPLSFRKEILKLGRPQTFSLQEKVIDFDQQHSNMYLIAEGNALLFQSPYSYAQFQKRLETVNEQQEEKAVLVSRPNFSKIVHVGTLILKYVQTDPLIKMMIKKGKRRLEAKKIEERIYEGDTGFTKLQPGSTFGDFLEAKGRVFKPQCVVAMSETLKTITIADADLKKLFAKILTPENIKLVRGQISTEVLTHNTVKKVSRCFNEREFPSGKTIITEGQKMKNIYIVKSGTCEVFSTQNPLRSNRLNDEEFFLKLPMWGDMLCLGLNQGTMCQPFNYYPISRVGQGTWIGEEAFFMDVEELSYSIKTLTAVKVLEISIIDFKDKIPQEMLEELQNICLKKQFLKIKRMQEIAKASKNLKESQEMHKFHQQALKALIHLHPHATQRIMKTMGNQFYLEGYIRTARYKDATNVGQIKKVDIDIDNRPESVTIEEEKQSPVFAHQDSSLSLKRLQSQSPKKKEEFVLEKQFGVQALSPSGKPIKRELESKQSLIARKLEALDQSRIQKMPKHVKQFQGSKSDLPASALYDREQDSPKRLDEKTKKALLGQGVEQNNALMLSLTTINGVPVNSNQDDDDVVFQPTEAQIEEIDHFLMRRKRNPIMEMREKSRMSANASSGKDNNSPQNSQSRQVIRSITFFNKQKAQEDKLKEMMAQKQVFKLSASVERMSSLQPLDRYHEHVSSGLRQNSNSRYYDENYTSQRIPSKQLVGPFLDSSVTSFMSRNQQQKQYIKTDIRAGSKQCMSPARQPQSVLYHAQKISAQDIQNLNNIKIARRLDLNRSLQYTSGLHESIREPAHRPLKMMNQNSSTLKGLPLPATSQAAPLFQEETVQEQNADSRYLQLKDAKKQESAMPYHNHSMIQNEYEQESQVATSHVFRLDLSRISQQQNLVTEISESIPVQDSENSIHASSKNQDLMLNSKSFVHGPSNSTMQDHLHQDIQRTQTFAEKGEDATVQNNKMSAQDVLSSARIENNLSLPPIVKPPVILDKSQVDSEKPLLADQEGVHPSMDQLEVKQVTVKHVDSSSSHASVLQDIERTVSIYSNYQTAQEGKTSKVIVDHESRLQNQQKQESNIAVITEMLSNRKRNLISQSLDPSSIKAYKTGPFKFQNLKNLDQNQQQYQLVEPKNLSPRGALLKYQSLKSPMVASQNESTSRNQPNNILKTSTASMKKEFEEKAFNHLSTTISPENASSGLQIVQMSLDSKPGQLQMRQSQKKYQSLKNRERSKTTVNASSSFILSHLERNSNNPNIRSPSPKNLLQNNKAPNMHLQMQRNKFASIQTKSEEKNVLRKQRTLRNNNHHQFTIQPKASHSSVNYQFSQKTIVPNDLADVMGDSYDHNFIRRKQPFNDSSSQPDKQDILKLHKPGAPKMVKIDIEKMNNTMGSIQIGTGSQLSFPQIVFEEEEKRGKGTAVFDLSGAGAHGKDRSDLKQKEPPDSSGTRYYVHSNEPHNAMLNSGKNSTSQLGEHQKDPLALAMGVTFSKDGQVVSNKFSGDDTGSRRYSNGTDDQPLNPIEKDGHIQRGSEEVTVADKAAKVAKIKVAIQKTASKKQQQELTQDEKHRNTAASRYLSKQLKLNAKRVLKKKQTSPRQNEEQAQHANIGKDTKSKFAQIQQKNSRSPPHVRKEKKSFRQSLDLKIGSTLVNKSTNFRAEEVLHPSEIDSINQVRNYSLLSDTARQNYDYLTRQNDELNEYLILGNKEFSESHKASTDIRVDRESPRYKHMPQPAYKTLKKNTDLKVPRQTYLEAIEKSPNSNQAVQSTAFKESTYIKNQKQANLGRQMLIESSKNVRSGTMLEDDGMDRSAVLGRSSIMRRSLILQDTNKEQMSLLFSEKQPDNVSMSMPRQDSVIIPSYSRMLHRQSQHGDPKVRNSQYSLGASSIKQGAGSTNLRISDDEYSQQQYQQASAAEKTKARFMLIKEEKRRMQQM